MGGFVVFSGALRRVSVLVMVAAAAFGALLAMASASSAGPTITVADSGDPLANGAALVAAVDEARTPNPSAADSVEISLAAGVFDLGWMTIDLPDGVDIVGAGPELTTICRCADQPADADASAPWFSSPGSNEIASLEVGEGPGLVVESSAGDAVFRDVVVSPLLSTVSNPSALRLVDASRGVVSVLGSELGETNGTVDALTRSIRATADAAIHIEDSELEGGSRIVEIVDGELNIVRSSLVANGTYVSMKAVLAEGAADITVRDSTFSLAGSEYVRTTLFDLQAGGTLDIAGSQLDCGLCGFEPFRATDATIVIADSNVSFDDLLAGSPIELSGGSVHLVNTSVSARWDQFDGVVTGVINLLDGASGSMSGGTLQAELPVGETSGPFVFDGVAIDGARVFQGDPNVVCIATTNVVDGETQAPPTGCVEGAPQSAFGGAAHVVPGVVEAENYDVGVSAGVSFADSDSGNFRDDYRFDDVDIWATVGEAGYTVGRTRGGEWLEYTIDVATASDYDIGVRLATGFSDPGTVRVSVDGSPVGTIADVPINGWWNFSTEPAGVVNLDAGEHVLRLDITGNGQINLDRIEMTAASGPGAGACGALAQEGETGSISGSMEVSGSTLASVSGTPNKYVFDGADYAEFCVTAPAAGTYELEAIVKAADSRSDSFYITVGDAEPFTWHIPNSPDSQVRQVPASFALAEGDNVVRFHHRETGTELDRFEFAERAAPVPGPVAPTSCRVTHSDGVATITFTPAADDNAVRYLLYRTENGGSSQWSASIPASADPSFAFIEADGVTYEYSVKTRGANNTFTGLTSCGAAAAAVPAAAPACSYYQSGRNMTVAWEPNGADSYHLYMFGYNSIEYRVAVVPGDAAHAQFQVTSEDRGVILGIGPDANESYYPAAPLAVGCTQAASGGVLPVDPVECTSTVVGDAVTVAWTAEIDDAADRYVLYARSAESPEPVWQGSVAPGEPSFTKGGFDAPAETAWLVKTRATLADGKRAYSDGVMCDGTDVEYVAGDSVAKPLPIAGLSPVAGSTLLATEEPTEYDESECPLFDEDGPFYEFNRSSVWFAWTPGEVGLFDLQAENHGVAVYAPSGPVTTLSDLDGSFQGCGRGSVTDPDQTLYVQVHALILRSSRSLPAISPAPFTLVFDSWTPPAPPRCYYEDDVYLTVERDPTFDPFVESYEVERIASDGTVEVVGSMPAQGGFAVFYRNAESDTWALRSIGIDGSRSAPTLCPG